MPLPSVAALKAWGEWCDAMRVGRPAAILRNFWCAGWEASHAKSE